jgi:hypothetical protein
MKHLRKFNESSVEDIKSNIEDILSDFSDRYIPVDVFLSTVVCQKVCSIQLGDVYEEISLEYADLDMIRIVPKDNKDEFLRIYDYMESEGYDFSSISYDSPGVSGDIVTLRIVDIGLGIDAFSNHLFNGIDETCYLKLFFKKIEK